MCLKIGCNINVRNRVNRTEFGRIVLNFNFLSRLHQHLNRSLFAAFGDIDGLFKIY
jgi:hypothetical protein